MKVVTRLIELTVVFNIVLYTNLFFYKQEHKMIMSDVTNSVMTKNTEQLNKFYKNVVKNNKEIFVNSNNFIIDFYKHTNPSVVTVYDKRNILEASTGSGVFISRRFVLTNNHVIEDSGDGHVAVQTIYKVLRGEVVYRNSDMDAAVVEIEDPMGDPVVFGDSSKLTIGDLAFSIGASVGLPNTLGVGYVTGLEREINLAPFTHIVQISTGIVPGNSGGGVFNTKGELIGISYAGANHDVIGFMIPINSLKFIIEKYSY